MVICGQEFEFSLMNANDLDRFEDANEQMQRRSAEETEHFHRGGVRLGDHARAQARIAMDCIDEILGAGASDRLGLNENYMAPIYDVIEELGNAFAAEKQRYAARAAQPMNRQQRRAEQKARQRTRTAGRMLKRITQKLERIALMMAKLWAQEIMFAETAEEAKALYERCPRLLKEKVKAILIKSGFEEIVQ